MFDKESFLQLKTIQSKAIKPKIKTQQKKKYRNKGNITSNKIKQFLLNKNKIKIKKSIINYEKKHIKHPEIILYHPMKKGTFWNSSPFGIRYNTLKKKYEMHGGVDFAAAEGTPVYAAAKGFVVEISIQTSGFGKSIVLKHEIAGARTRYAHLSKILVSSEQQVEQGQIIGLVGATGNTRGRINASHLHFELIIDNKKYNPMLHLQKSIK